VCDTLRTRSAPPDAAPWTRWTGAPDPARLSTRLTLLVVGRNDPRFVPSANGLSRFTDRFAGEIVRRGDADYDAARAVWNSAIDRRPELIVRPTDADDVVTALRFAVEQDLVIAVRCGGHSIPGLSTCDDGIVIDLSRMSGAKVDPEARTARVAGGSLLAVLDEAAQVHELVCPVGVVSHTGVAGLTLGGGMGRLQRKLGLTIDSLLAVDVVTADGRVVHASEEENPELFWGMRGAGPNFGIVTSFEFRLHPFDGQITHGFVKHRLQRAAELAALYRELVEDGPDDLWASFGIELASDAPGGARVFVSVLHIGSEAAAERDLAALRVLGTPLEDSVERKEYLATQRMLDAPMAWGQRFAMKSCFLGSLPDELVRRWVEHIPDVPDGVEGGFSVWPWGRAIAAVGEDDTAFTGRNAAFWAASELFWADPELDDACRAWARTATADMEPYTVVGRYVNDVVEVGADVARTIYGDTKYDRLRALKRAWDPDNVFQLNQNIRP
jgi:FAD/FMN-containing dehydrogenase